MNLQQLEALAALSPDESVLELLTVTNSARSATLAARKRMVDSTAGRAALAVSQFAFGAVFGYLLPDLLLFVAFGMLGGHVAALRHLRKSSMALSSASLTGLHRGLARACALTLDDYSTLLTHRALGGALTIGGANLGALQAALNLNEDLSTGVLMSHTLTVLAICAMGAIIWLNLRRWGVQHILMRLAKEGR